MSDSAVFYRCIPYASMADLSKIKDPERKERLYPNPSNGIFFNEIAGADKQWIQIYDCTGKLVLSQFVMGAASIDASILVNGVYTVSIFNNEGIVNKRLVIVK